MFTISKRGGSEAAITANYSHLTRAAELCFGTIRAAQRLGVGKDTMRWLRSVDDGPRFMSDGNRAIYRQCDLDDWEHDLPVVSERLNFGAIEQDFEVTADGIVHHPTGRVLSRRYFLAAFERMSHPHLRMAEAWLRWGGAR